MVFIASQIFEVLLGELFAPAYLPYCARATVKDPPFAQTPLILYEMMSNCGSKSVENAT